MQSLGGRTLDWLDDAVVMVDQTRLPESFHMIRISTVPDLVAAIRRLSVRGAPAIGVAGAFGVALAARNCGVGNSAFDDAVQMIRTARPTAVNLAKMVDRVAAAASRGPDAVLEEAFAVRDEELAASEKMGIHGADLVTELSVTQGGSPVSSEAQRLRLSKHCTNVPLLKKPSCLKLVRYFREHVSPRGNFSAWGLQIGWWLTGPAPT